MRVTDPDYRPFGVYSDGDETWKTTSIRVFQWVPNERSTTGCLRKKCVKTFRGKTGAIKRIRERARSYAESLNSVPIEEAEKVIKQSPDSITVW